MIALPGGGAEFLPALLGRLGFTGVLLGLVFHNLFPRNHPDGRSQILYSHGNTTTSAALIVHCSKATTDRLLKAKNNEDSGRIDETHKLPKTRRRNFLLFRRDPNFLHGHDGGDVFRHAVSVL